MSKFEIGDRVRVVADHVLGPKSKWVGQYGRLAPSDLKWHFNVPCDFVVQMESQASVKGEYYFFEDELEVTDNE